LDKGSGAPDETYRPPYRSGGGLVIVRKGMPSAALERGMHGREGSE
jgi:hypothetical protein